MRCLLPHLMGLVVQHMVLTGTTVGDGVLAQEVDRVMVQALAGLLPVLGEVLVLVLVQGPGQVLDRVLVMGTELEEMVLMVVAMVLEIQVVVAVAAGMETTTADSLSVVQY